MSVAATSFDPMPAAVQALPPDAPPSGTRSVGTRRADAAIDPRFIQRWSSRAFSRQKLPHDVVRSLFEAARFAPSAGNTQPWLFVYASDPETRKRALGLLKAENQRWAVQAPLLVFVFARRKHPQTGMPLRTGAFDTGAAWFSLAMQAHALGLNCRAMGGIHHEAIYAVLGVPQDEFESMIAVAVGYPGRIEDLPADLAERDVPTPRRRQHELVFNGRYVDPETQARAGATSSEG